MASPINTAVMKLKLRAERSTRDHLIQTFVDVDPLLTLLQTEDHQILYGRRGTGKTHALEYLASDRDDAGDLPLYLDMRLIGSSGGLYSDPNIPLAERATRLLVDTLQAVHEQMLNTVVEQDDVFDGSIVFPLLDNYLEAASQVVVSGVVTSESGAQGKSTRTKGAALTAGIKKIPEAQLSLNIGDALEEQVNYKRTQTGESIEFILVR